MPVPSQETNMVEAFEATVSGRLPTGDGGFVRISKQTAQEIRVAAQERHGHFGVEVGAPEMNGQK